MPKTDIEVKIIGEDGNVFNLLSICRSALSRAHRLDLWDEFYKKATSGNYDNALATIMEYFIVS